MPILLVMSAACGGATATDDQMSLDVVTFEQLDPVLLDPDTVAAVVAGSVAGPSYNSFPPTSGARAGDYARCGIYRQAIPELYQVASLARGSVIVHYRSSFTADARDSVEASVRPLADGVIVAPSSGLGAPVVLTAWGVMLEMPLVDRGTIEAFVEQYGGSGPSPATCPPTVDES